MSQYFSSRLKKSTRINEQITIEIHRFKESVHELPSFLDVLFEGLAAEKRVAFFKAPPESFVVSWNRWVGTLWFSGPLFVTPMGLVVLMGPPY